MHPVAMGRQRSRRDTSAYLRPVAQALVNALELRPPTTTDPGHWKSADGFVAISTALIKDGFTGPEQKLRALVAFHPRQTQEVVQQRIRREFPKYDTMTQEERRSHWSRILQIGKQARTERVSEILRELEARDIELPVHNLVVHRVSHTFFVTLDLPLLERLVALRASGFDELKRIHIEKASSY